ncbi:GlxA family transcriptional regulator [Aureimonas frigidaquae]|uniref:GlxA family transcriptional regulator n=1 Tax=Aureimonas frigidaquae TaxID=424757 RepID=UPI000784B78D|nr:GlxA family transcriptional regulator [Aureimonas frigidaquae]
MPAPPDLSALRSFAFLTLPNYSMVAAMSAIEACRIANYLAGETVYEWQVVSLSGAPVEASNGLSLARTVALADAARADILFVCGGLDIRHAIDKRLLEELRRLARRGQTLGALCTGSFALAQAGLLDGRRCAIHWENLTAIAEEFPDVHFVEDIFVIDRDRVTCTGGTAPMDLMAALVEARLGRSVKNKLARQFILERLRGQGESQQQPLSRQGQGHPALDLAADLMRKTVDAPMSVTAIAARASLSSRQLERLFRQHTGVGPAEYYLSLRLAHARDLLRQSELSITAVGIACGFVSPAHFSAAYRRRYGHTPRSERLRPAAPAAATQAILEDLRP